MSPTRGRPIFAERFGRFRLHALPAVDVWHAQRTLTLDAVGPSTTVTVALDAAGLRPGDVAGLALFARPYAWLGVERRTRGFVLAQFDERSGQVSRIPLDTPRISLRAECRLTRHRADFRYSGDGTHYSAIGVRYTSAQDDLAQGFIPCAVFCVGRPAGPPGGHADFANLVAVIATSRAPSNREGRAQGPRRTPARAGRSRDA